jgi:hypothetical protein
MKKILVASLFSVLLSASAFAQQPVNLADVAGAATATGNGTNGGAIRVAIASDNTAFSVNAVESGTWNVGLSAGSNTVGKIDILGNGGASMDVAQGGATAATNAIQIAGVYNTSLPTLTNGQGGAAQLDASGRLLVDCATGCSAGGTISLVPHTSGGLTTKHFVAAASDNATNVKSSAGQVYNIHVYNNAAYPVYLKLYNASSSPTGCAATNLTKVIGVQAGTELNLNSEEGFAFGTGIGYCLTKGITDTDDTAVLLSDATVDVAYD